MLAVCKETVCSDPRNIEIEERQMIPNLRVGRGLDETKPLLIPGPRIGRAYWSNKPTNNQANLMTMHELSPSFGSGIKSYLNFGSKMKNALMSDDDDDNDFKGNGVKS